MTQSGVAEEEKQEYERVVGEDVGLDLFGAGGPFDGFPGAVLIAGHNGIVLATNDRAEDIGGMLRSGAFPDLRAAVTSALSGKAAQINPLFTPRADNGESTLRAFDVVVLPWGDGTAALLLGRDITLERSLRSALIESRQRFKDLVEAACDFAWETNAQGEFIYFSNDTLLGREAAELLGATADVLLVEPSERTRGPFTTREVLEKCELWARHADGDLICLSVTALPLCDADGRWVGARGLCWDITEQRNRETATAGAQTRERLLSYVLSIVRDELEPTRMLEAAADALLPALSVSGAMVYRVADGGEMELRIHSGKEPPKALCDRVIRSLDGGVGEFEFTTESGRVLAHATNSGDARNGMVVLWRAGTADDWGNEDRKFLSEVATQVGVALQQLSRQSELERLSTTDSLTGLLNRRGFEENLQRRFHRASGRGRGGALFFVDLDNFKCVNDVHGHQTGDSALMHLARILKEYTRQKDMMARFGGDEFAIFIDGVDAEAALQKAELLLQAGRQLEKYSGGDENPLGLSIGVAVYEAGSGEELESLLRRADEAMYVVKRSGKDGTMIAPAFQVGRK